MNTKRKAALKEKRKTALTEWEVKFSPILKEIHGNHSKRIFHRLMKKSCTLKSSLKRRSKEYEVLYAIELREIRNMLLDCYGKVCKYCTNRLDVTNIACDHIIPLSMGGESSPENLQFICNRCNTRKGPLTDTDYGMLLEFLKKQEHELREYVLRKLAKSDEYM
jgi:5-methylcytosine-specific restriction endonuclease McrA